ncbi:MAG: hydroxysqualene dehydroxylase HpnE [Candidatus Kapabacteria bacterium]|nr:hydroxysqualene dehydroxylase HpnE [Candidatus Kapabacteria bacterium]
MEVLIIGGGWSGIAAAIEATQRGVRVTLVEERHYLGGRARSFTDRVSGDEIDNGQHVMMGCYRALLNVVRTLGTEHLLERQSALRVAFVDTSGQSNVLDASRLPGMAGLGLALLRLSGIKVLSRLAAVRLALRIALGRASTTGLTCAEFLRQHHQPNDVIERFWEPVVLATINAPINKASADLLVTVMRLAFLGSTQDAQLLIPMVGLSDLIRPFQKWLEERGGVCMIGTGVEALERADDRIHSVRLSNGNTIEVQSVISCIPQRALHRLLLGSDMEPLRAAATPSSPIVSVYLWYSESWMSTDFAAALGTTVQWVFDKRRIRPGLVAVTVSAGYGIVTEQADEIVSLCDRELRQLFPSMKGVELKRGVVIKEKHATPLFTLEMVAVRPASTELSTVVSNLFIAGDWTDTGLPATLEGAARSGVNASTYALSQSLPNRQ